MRNILQTLLVTALLPFLLSACGGSSANYSPKIYGSGAIVAVWDLENFSVTENQILDDMQEFLSAKVAETFKEQGGYVIVERQKLLLALEELALGNSALVSEASQLQIGRMLGAQLMVFGGYQQVGEQLRIDLRLIEVESGAVIRVAEHTATASEVSALLTAAEAAALDLLK